MLLRSLIKLYVYIQILVKIMRYVKNKQLKVRTLVVFLHFIGRLTIESPIYRITSRIPLTIRYYHRQLVFTWLREWEIRFLGVCIYLFLSWSKPIFLADSNMNLVFGSVFAKSSRTASWPYHPFLEAFRAIFDTR